MNSTVEPERHANTRVSKRDWEQAALVTIARHGVGKLSIEALARELNITKGSFYWHFKNRDDLIDHAIQLWVRQGVTEVIAELQTMTSPRQRLRTLFSYTFEDHETGPLDALLHAQANDPTIGPAVEEITATRTEFLQSTFEELGLSPDRAAARARLIYAAYIGTGILAEQGLPERSQSAVDSFNRELEIFLSD